MTKHALTIPDVEKRLRAAGLRPTSQRLAIARYVLCDAEHPTAEDVKAWADQHFHRMSLATVYNTLASLVKAGLLKELKLPHKDSVVYDDNLSDHYHFLDEKTGRLWDIDPERVKVTLNLGPRVRIRRMDVVLHGSNRQ